MRAALALVLAVTAIPLAAQDEPLEGFPVFLGMGQAEILRAWSNHPCRLISRPTSATRMATRSAMPPRLRRPQCPGSRCRGANSRLRR